MEVCADRVVPLAVRDAVVSDLLRAAIRGRRHLGAAFGSGRAPALARKPSFPHPPPKALASAERWTAPSLAVVPCRCLGAAAQFVTEAVLVAELS